MDVTLPVQYQNRLEDLEVCLAEGKLNKSTIMELFDLYNMASLFYEEQGMETEFLFFLKKMQRLCAHPKVSYLLNRRNSQDFRQQFTLTPEMKQQKLEKIKKIIHDQKAQKTGKVIKTETKGILEAFSSQQDKNQKIISQELSAQESNFKKRLEEKRGNSNPHGQLTNRLLTRALTTYNKNYKIKDQLLNETTLVARVATPPKRQSILARNMEADIHKPLPQPQLRSSFIIQESKIEARIEEILMKLWSRAEEQANIMNNSNSLQSEIEQLLSELSNEGLRTAVEIHCKYDPELKSLEADLDLTDATNVHTIIYQNLISDRDREIAEAMNLIEEKKKNGIKQLKERKLNSSTPRTNIFNKNREISKVKLEIHDEIKKIIKKVGHHEDQQSSDSDDSSDGEDQISLDSVSLNPKMRKNMGMNKRSSRDKPNAKRSVRVSTGDLSQGKAESVSLITK